MHAMASIYGEDKVVMFGGLYYPGPNQYFRDDTWVYQDFLPTKNGSFVSTPYDTGYNSSFITISWYATTPVNTSLRFQLKSAVNASSLSSKDFVGPDGTNTSHYDISASSIWPGHNVTRWVQYKVYFNISIFTDSPSLKDFTITFNCLPTTMVVSPINGSLLTYNKPTFKWTFEDHDSEHQKAFQVQIDDNINFEDVRFDSGKQITEKQGWEFPTGTNFTELPEGTWYWRVRTMDADDFWTDFSLPRALKIDTVIPSSAPTIPINNGFYNSLNMISGIATDKTDCSGLKKVEISIKRLNDIYYWDGGDWVPFATWLTANGTENWMYDSSAVKWTSGKRYYVQSRAIDHGTNVELPKSGNIFTIDMAYPTSTISIPTENTWLNNVFTLSGLSSDIGGSGTDKVEISIKCAKDYIEWD
ncbi:MAG: hypothetical protein KAJ51_11315, partial [Thermoplasmata archaeon]|nr:hypothetical protein [Thermoplasmata archaeon]